MLFQYEINIPRGFVVDIESWENDADDYRTIRHTGLDEKDVEFFRLVCPYVGPGSSCSNTEFGEELVWNLWELCKENPHMEPFFKYWIGITSNTVDENEEVDPDDMRIIMDKIQHNLSYSPVNYDSNFIRVVSGLTVAFVEEDIYQKEIRVNSEYVEFDWRVKVG